jgi:Family of unknown function (DUF6713)
MLMLIVLFGFERVARSRRGARGFSAFLAAAGLCAFSIHTVFIMMGHQEFRTPASVSVLLAILAVSIAQLVVVARPAVDDRTGR